MSGDLKAQTATSQVAVCGELWPGTTGLANTDYSLTLTSLSIPTLIESCLDRIESPDSEFNQAFGLACELDSALNWPDVDALADLVLAELQEQQAGTPAEWIEARLKWFDAHARYFGYGRPGNV